MGRIPIYCRKFLLAGGAVTYHSLGYVGQVVGYVVCGVAGVLYLPVVGNYGVHTKKLPSHRCGTTLLVTAPLERKARLIFSDILRMFCNDYWRLLLVTYSVYIYIFLNRFLCLSIVFLRGWVVWDYCMKLRGSAAGRDRNLV